MALRRGSIMRTAATASMISTARRNKAERKAIEQNTNQSQASTASDPVVEIKKYKELLDQGILTQEEFDKKKKELLGL